MHENENATPPVSADPPDERADDDLPDLSTPYWEERIAKATVRRGRPRSERPKVSTTIRLSPEVIEHFRAGGPGWQSRIDEALRKVIGAE
jgi:uncharacterized protein (DUF4415 family)